MHGGGGYFPGERGVAIAMKKHYLFWFGMVAGFFLIVWLLRSILLPFVLGIAIAWFLDPLVSKMIRRRIPRMLCSIATLVVLFGILVAVGLLVVPLVADQVSVFVAHLPGYYAQGLELVRPLVDRAAALAGAGSPERLQQTGIDGAKKLASLAGNAALGVLQGGVSLLSLISLLAITPLVAFYLLVQWPDLVSRIDGYLPRRHAETIRLLAGRVDSVLKGFVNGSVVVVVSLSLFYAVALSIMGLQYGLTIGLIAGIASFIPYLGTAFGLLAAVGVALFQFWPSVVMPIVALVIFVTGQLAADYVLTPRIMGDRVHLHPLWVIFGIFAFSALFGFIGMIIAVPITAVIGVLVRFFMKRYEESDVYIGK